MTIFGGGQAAGLQSRFAAADLASPQRRARDISRVVWVATIGGVLGPVLNSTEDTAGRSLGLGPWVGPMIAAVPPVPDRRRLGRGTTPARSALIAGRKGRPALGGAAPVAS